MGILGSAQLCSQHQLTQSGPRPSASTTTTTTTRTHSTLIMAHNDPYAGIEFDDITESTGLAADEIKCLKTCFDLFDTKKVDFLSADDLGEIMRAMGFRPTEEELEDLLEEIDEDGSGSMDFDEFCEMMMTKPED